MKKYLILKSDKFKDFEVVDPDTIKHVSYTNDDGESTLTLNTLQEGMESLEFEDELADEYAKCVKDFYFGVEVPTGKAVLTGNSGKVVTQTPEETEMDRLFKVTKSLDEIQLYQKKGF